MKNLTDKTRLNLIRRVLKSDVIDPFDVIDTIKEILDAKTRDGAFKAVEYLREDM